MQEGDDLMAHINHVKELADQLTAFEVPVREEDVVMTLLESLSTSFENLIVALETLRFEGPHHGVCDRAHDARSDQAQGE